MWSRGSDRLLSKSSRRHLHKKTFLLSSATFIINWIRSRQQRGISTQGNSRQLKVINVNLNMYLDNLLDKMPVSVPLVCPHLLLLKLDLISSCSSAVWPWWLELQTIHPFSLSQRKLSPGWKTLLAISHLRHALLKTLNRRLNKVSRNEIGTLTQFSVANTLVCSRDLLQR